MLLVDSLSRASAREPACSEMHIFSISAVHGITSDGHPMDEFAKLTEAHFHTAQRKRKDYWLQAIHAWLGLYMCMKIIMSYCSNYGTLQIMEASAQCIYSLCRVAQRTMVFVLSHVANEHMCLCVIAKVSSVLVLWYWIIVSCVHWTIAVQAAWSYSDRVISAGLGADITPEPGWNFISHAVMSRVIKSHTMSCTLHGLFSIETQGM